MRSAVGAALSRAARQRHAQRGAGRLPLNTGWNHSARRRLGKGLRRSWGKADERGARAVSEREHEEGGKGNRWPATRSRAGAFSIWGCCQYWPWMPAAEWLARGAAPVRQRRQGGAWQGGVVEVAGRGERLRWGLLTSPWTGHILANVCEEVTLNEGREGPCSVVSPHVVCLP